MGKIGFIDYYISEWHANNYPKWFEMANQKLGTDFKLSYAWAEKDISPVDGVSTDEWCEKFGVERCGSIAELCKKSDCIVILAPSDPQTHLEYAKQALPFGKPTYIDKTFAPDFNTAKEIFEIAQRYNTPFFSTSALRYASELKIGDISSAVITGGGSNFNEYIIHTVEMAVVLLDAPVTKVKVENIGVQRICRLVAENNVSAVIHYSPANSFGVTAELKDGRNLKNQVSSEFFVELSSEIIRFFTTKKPPFNPAETLEVMRIRDALLKAENYDGEWINLY